MSKILCLSGRYASIIRLGSGVVPSSENSRYPAANIIASNPTKPWLAGSAISPQHLTFDANLLENANGGLESWAGGIPVGWFVTYSSGATILEEADPANVHGGARAARISKSTSPQYAFLYKPFTVPSGSLFRIRCFVKDGTPKTGIYIQCLETGQFCKPPTALSSSAESLAESWSPTPVRFHGFTASSQNPGAYTEEITAFFRVEDWWEKPGNAQGRLSTYKDLVTIRVMIGWPENTGPTEYGTFFLDDVLLLPAIDFASVVYHNLRTRDRLRIQASDDGSTFADVASFTSRNQQAYVTFDTRVSRYWRLRMDAPAGYNIGGVFDQGAPMVGELVLGQAKSLTVAEEYGHSKVRDWPQQRDEAGIYAYAQEDHPTQGRTLVLEPRSPGGDWEGSAEVADVLFNLYERSRGGALPLVVVPDDTKDAVYYGRFQPGLQLSRENFVVHKTGLELRGFPVPVIL